MKEILIISIFQLLGNCHSAIKNIESNSTIHFQVIPTTGTATSVNSSASSATNIPDNTHLLKSHNSTSTRTATQVSSSSLQTSTVTTASTALGKSAATLNFNQSADNQISLTTNNNNNSNTNAAHNQNNQMDNGQTNSQHHQSIVNHTRPVTTAANRTVNAPITTATPPLVLSLSQVSFDFLFVITIKMMQPSSSLIFFLIFRFQVPQEVYSY